MGMDIYGLDPKLTEERPLLDYENATDEVKKAYFEFLDEWEQNNPGYYFRANVWSWRPINQIIYTVNLKYNLQLNIEGFDNNSGNGIKNQGDCDLLADAIEEYLEIETNFKNSEVMYINLGMWVADDNSFSVKENQENKLNRDYPIGSVLYSSIITDQGKLVRPAWGVSLKHVEKFVNFLRYCGGFEIW